MTTVEACPCCRTRCAVLKLEGLSEDGVVKFYTPIKAKVLGKGRAYRDEATDKWVFCQEPTMQDGPCVTLVEDDGMEGESE